MARQLWTEEEMVLVLALYYQLPFGKLDQRTNEVKALGHFIRDHINENRSDGAVAFRLTNYAACDPYIINSGRKGMPNGKKTCLPYWDKYADNKEQLFIDAEKIKEKYDVVLDTPVETSKIPAEQLVGLTKEAIIKIRVNQEAFRNMILNNYDTRCAITGINEPHLLVASHIVPWAEDESQRLNPENGICLSSLYDKAFDRGLITIRPDDYTIEISKELQEYKKEDFYEKHFGCIENKKIILPIDHNPSAICLQYHRDNIFSRHN